MAKEISVGAVVIDLMADTAKLVSGMERAERTVKKSIKNIKNTVLSLASAYVGFSGIEKILRTGIEFNRNMENSVAGLTALTVATSSNISVMGKHLSIMEKYRLAQIEANKTTRELIRINAQTPYTLEQTLKIYKTMYPTMKKVGASISQMVDITKKLSIAAGYSGIQFRELLAGVDGIATGTVMANSNLGRFLRSLGLTNEKLKNSKDVVGLLLDKFKDFKAVDTFDVALSNAKNSLQVFAGELSKPIFDTFKEGLKESSSWLDDLTKKLKELKLENTDISQFHTLEEKNKKILSLAKQWNELNKEYLEEKRDPGLFDMSGEYLRQRRAIEGKIALLSQDIENMDIKEKDALKTKVDAVKQSASASQKVWEDYYKKLGNIQKAWLVSQTRSKAYDNALLLGLKSDDLKKYIKKYKDEYLSPLTKENKKTKSIWKETLSKSIDRKTYFKDLFSNLGYSIKAYDKAVEIYQKLSKKYANDPKALKIIKENYDKAITNLNDWLKLNYKAAKEIPTIWDDISKSMAESMEQNFFDEITGKFKSFKEFMRSLFRDLASSIINPFAHQLAGGLTNSIMGMFSGGTTQATKKLTKKDAIKLGLKALGDGVYQDKSGNKIVTDTLGNVTRAYNSKGNVINDVMALKSIATLPSTIKAIPTAISGGFAGLQASLQGNIVSPFVSTSNFLASNGFVNSAYGVANFGRGFSGGLVGRAGDFSSFASGAGSVLGSGLLGYGIGSLGDRILGADTHAGIGGATGAIIGSIIPGVGTLIGGLAGSVLGGLFGKTKVTGQNKGIEFLKDVSKDDVDGRDFLTTYYKKKSWFHTKKWSSTTYKDFNDTDINAIKRVISNYDYLLTELGKSAEIVIKAGKYKSIDDFLSTGATKAFLKEATSADLDKVYKAWETYAKAVNKKVYEAFNDQINTYIKDIRDWKVWLLERSGDSISALNYKSDYLEKDFENLAHTFNIFGVTIDNFLQKYKEVISKNLTPDEIKKWEALGNALKSATDAQDAYTKAIKAFKQKIQNDIDVFTVDYYTNSNDTLGLLHYNAGKYNPIIANLKKQVGDTSITFTNFVDKFKKAVSKGLTDKKLKIWEDLGNALNKATAAANSLKDYNEKIAEQQKQIVENSQKLWMSNLSNLNSIFKDLSKSTNDFIDAWTGGSINNRSSYEFYARRYNEQKNAIAKDLANNNYTQASEDFNSFINIANNLKNSVKSIGDYNLINKVTKTVLKDMLNYKDTFVSMNDTTKAILSGNATLENIETYTKNTSLYTHQLTRDNNNLFITTINSLLDYLKDTHKSVVQSSNTSNSTSGSGPATSPVFGPANTSNSISGEDDYMPIITVPKKVKIPNALDSIGQGVAMSNFQAQGIYNTDVTRMIDAVNTLKSSGASDLDIAKEENYRAAMFFQDVGNPANLSGDVLATYNKMKDYYKQTQQAIIKLGGVPKYADGGIVTKPTIGLIAEAGYPEAVIPMKNGKDIPVQINNSEVVEELKRLRDVNEQMNAKITRLERVISRNEGENGLMMEVAA